MEIVVLQDVQMNACNYNADATTDDGSCTYAAEGLDCEGNCLSGDAVTINMFDSYGDGWWISNSRWCNSY